MSAPHIVEAHFTLEQAAMLLHLMLVASVEPAAPRRVALLHAAGELATAIHRGTDELAAEVEQPKLPLSDPPKRKRTYKPRKPRNVEMPTGQVRSVEGAQGSAE